MIPSCGDVAQATCFAAAVASFWRKDFEKLDLAGVAVLLGFACTSNVYLLMAAWPVSETMAHIVGFPLGRVLAGAWKNIFMIVVHVVFYVFRAQKKLGFNQYGGVASIAATIQLIRRPEHLKSKLRGLRIASGPLYMFSAMGAFQDKMEIGLGGSLAAIGFVMVLAAATLMKPDNDALDFALFGLRGRKKMKCHGLLMVANFTILLWLQWREGSWFALINLLPLILEIDRRYRRRILDFMFASMLLHGFKGQDVYNEERRLPVLARPPWGLLGFLHMPTVQVVER